MERGLIIERILRENSLVMVYALDLSLGVLKKAKDKGLKAHSSGHELPTLC